MARPPVSVTIITLNEEKNLARAIESVRSVADEVIVVDSGSSDRTCEIARSMGARVEIHPFRGYGQQKNYAQDLARHDWILNLDADEALSPELAGEIQSALGSPDPVDGYLMPRMSYYLGRWIRHGGWYPNRILRLYRKSQARWTEPEVHEECVVRGPIRVLRSDLHHYPFRDIQDQVRTNLRYSKEGSEALRRKGRRRSLALLILKPIGKFIETYAIKRGFLDGIAGFIISINAAHSIFLKYAYLFEAPARTAAERPETDPS